MAENQYRKWLEYRKWYDKQKKKGFALSRQAYVWYDSFEEYMRQYEYVKILKEEDKEAYHDKSYYDIIKSRSYEGSARQTEYFIERVSGILAELEAKALSGDTTAKEQLEDFFAKFGDIRNADKQEIIYQQLKSGNLHYEYHGPRSHGWYGNLMEMMTYFEHNGIVD